VKIVLAMDSTREFLLTVDPFSRLSRADLDRISSVAQEVSCRKGETIFSEGSEADSVWVLRRGRVEIMKYSSEDRPQALEIIDPKGVMGTFCRIADRQAPYPCTAIAATDCDLIRVKDQTFWELLDTSTGFLMGVCSLCSQRLMAMQEATRHSHEHVQKRIARTLLDLSKKHGNVLLFTKREIAELAATSVETAIRMLSAFERKHWISSSRGRIVLKDHSKLQSLLDSIRP
jgi:CRP/FNR family transcriptional regulator